MKTAFTLIALFIATIASASDGNIPGHESDSFTRTCDNIKFDSEKNLLTARCETGATYTYFAWGRERNAMTMAETSYSGPCDRELSNVGGKLVCGPFKYEITKHISPDDYLYFSTIGCNLYGEHWVGYCVQACPKVGKGWKYKQFYREKSWWSWLTGDLTIYLTCLCYKEIESEKR